MRAFLVLVVVAGCNFDFETRKAPEPALARRIAEKQAAVMTNPSDVNARLDLGQLQLEGEQWFEAAETFLTAKESGSQDIRVYAGLTSAYYELGYMNPMIESLKTCIQMDRSNPDCLFAYGKLIEPDQSERARQELRQVWVRLLMVAPNHRKAAYVRSSLDQLNAALGPMEAPAVEPSSQPASQPAETPDAPPTEAPANRPAAAVPGHPGGGDVEPREDVGELNPFGQAIARAIQAVSKNDAPTAELAFRDALKIRPDDPGATAGLAETLFAQNKQAEAVTTVEKAYQLDPKDAQVRWAFGLIMIKNKKRLEEAVGAWEALVKDDPEYADRLGIPKQLETIKKFMKK